MVRQQRLQFGTRARQFLFLHPAWFRGTADAVGDDVVDRRPSGPLCPGGDGGRGGSIYAIADRNINTLIDYRYARIHRAKRGENGRGADQYGKGADDVVLRMPVGTIVTDVTTGLTPSGAKCGAALLKSAGAVILGKTVTTEFATSRPGKTRNPHNAAHTPGGSSSGSAAAVAAGMVGINVGIPVPLGMFGFTGHKNSFFGDLHAMGTDGVRFFTELKSVTTHWFSEAEAREGRVLNSWDGMISMPNQ